MSGLPARRSRRGTRPVERVPRLLLTRQEAAASLGMSIDTFERRVQPFLKVVPCGQLVLVPPLELERWVATHARYLIEPAAGIDRLSWPDAPLHALGSSSPTLP
jgi:hypothetical protein